MNEDFQEIKFKFNVLQVSRESMWVLKIAQTPKTPLAQSNLLSCQKSHYQNDQRMYSWRMITLETKIYVKFPTSRMWVLEIVFNSRRHHWLRITFHPVKNPRIKTTENTELPNNNLLRNKNLSLNYCYTSMNRMWVLKILWFWITFHLVKNSRSKWLRNR